MNLDSRKFYFLEESNRNIDFKELNSIILNNTLNEGVGTRVLGGLNNALGRASGGTKKFLKDIYDSDVFKKITSLILPDSPEFQAYLANKESQGPLGRLGGEYKEAGLKTFIAPYRMAPQALEGSALANLSRSGRTSKSSQIQYGPVKF
jgi:hypothetical protein